MKTYRVYYSYDIALVEEDSSGNGIRFKRGYIDFEDIEEKFDTSIARDKINKMAEEDCVIGETVAYANYYKIEILP